MPDFLNTLIEKLNITGRLKSLLDHNRWWVVYILFAALLVGCAVWQPRGTSPSDPQKQVTRAQLEADVKAYIARVEAADAEIAAKEWLVQQGIQAISGSIAAVPTPWTGVIGTLLVAANGASVLNGRRKDSVIEKLAKVK